jgi:hypothetical protein
MRPFPSLVLLATALSGALVLAPASSAPAADDTCVFSISMVSGTDVNNLDYTVNYTGTAGQVLGSGSRPECVNALSGQAFAGFHDDDAGILKVSSIRLTYFSAPQVIAACRISHDSLEPAPGDFSVFVTNAGRDGEDSNVIPLPVVQVTSVDCPGTLPTTTTTTTTTLPPTTTTTLPSGSRCGFPVTDGSKPTSGDALRTLRVAVGIGTCALCVCDVNSSGAVTTADALTILRAAVGTEVTLGCPAC